MSSAVLSLLIALLSVAAFTVPVLIKAFRSTTSNTTVTPPVFDGQSLQLNAVNRGDDPATFETARIQTDGWPNSFVLKLGTPEMAYLPKGSRPLRFDISMTYSIEQSGVLGERAFARYLRDEPVGRVTVSIRESNGQPRHFDFPLSGAEVTQLMLAHSSRCMGLSGDAATQNGCFDVR